MEVYDVQKLMDETRRLAAAYRHATGQTLPVSAELCRYDAQQLLDLISPEEPEAGIDAISKDEEPDRYQIKGRVIFDESKSGQRLGNVNLDTDWDYLLLVLMDDEYNTQEIWQMDRATAEEAILEGADSKRARRGAMSVAKFRALGKLVWSREDGQNAGDLWDNTGSRA